MKKTTAKMNIYAFLFLLRSILFNVTLAFSITALVFMSDGLSLWAIIAIALAGSWVLTGFLTHATWHLMSRIEKALYLTIRRHGKGIVHLSEKELSKRGQQDITGVLHDIDSGLEIQMLINGTGTFINTVIGIKWISAARKFNRHEGTFEYEIN